MRTTGVERLYFLGDFKNVKITNIVTDIPEEVGNNEKAMNLITRLTLIACDKSYLQYKELMEEEKLAGKDVLEWLENQRQITYNALLAETTKETE